MWTGITSYQAPGSVAAVQVDDGTEVVVQGDVDEKTTGDPILLC